MVTKCDLVASRRASSIPDFHIVVAYDDFSAGRCAAEVCHRFIAELRAEYIFHAKMWNFSLLRNLDLNAVAANETAQAQLIVIATCSSDLPIAIKKWGEGWVVRRGGRHGLLVALVNLDAPGGGSSPAENFLRSVAASGGMQFALGGVNGLPDGDLAFSAAFASRTLN